MNSLRSRVNASAGSKGGLGGLVLFLSGYFKYTIAWDWTLIGQPENLEQLIVGGFLAFTGTGLIAGHNRDQKSPVDVVEPNVSPVEPRIEVPAPVVVSKPVEPVIAAPIAQIPEAPKNYFSDAELDCKCIDLDGCDYQGIHAQTLKMANELREHFGPLIVNSAYRCPEHNRRIGGAPASYHVKGMAMDVRSATATPDEMYSWLNNKYPRQYGLGNYKTFVHLDARTSAWARKAGPDQQWRSFENEPVDVELVAA